MKRRSFLSLIVVPFLSKLKIKEESKHLVLTRKVVREAINNPPINLTGIPYHHCKTNGTWLGISRSKHER